jgi:hypothetical protein
VVADDSCGAMGAERSQMRQVGFMTKPELEWCYVGWEGAVGHTLFDVGCSENGKWPEVVAEVGVDKHCSHHAADGEVCAFGDYVLWWGVRYCLFICDAIGFAEFFHLSVDEFGSVVDLEKH